MTSGHLVALLANLRRLASVRETAALSDGHLVERYVLSSDESAFAALVQRHGGMVWNVCRRVLTDDADADDAFQATFLVLLHKAATLRGRTSLAGWLQGVAWRLARKLKAETTRRRLKERCVEAAHPVDGMAEVEQRNLRALLDEELERLPEKYRLPLVLCYLEGKTYAEAAKQLDWKEGTVCGRLARARELLRQRLSRRGVTLSGAALLAALTEPASVPAATMVATVRMAGLFALGQSAGNGAVATLAQGVLHAMTVAKLKTMAALLAIFCVVVGSDGLVAQRLWTAKALPSERAEIPPALQGAEQPRRKQPAHTDRYGDPLPERAVKRFGSTRLRHVARVLALSWSPDGKLVASSGRDGVICLWDAASGRLVRSIKGVASCLAFTPDGKGLAGGLDARVCIWEVVTGKELLILDALPAKLRQLADRRKQFRGPGGDLVEGRFYDSNWFPQTNSLAFSADGRLLAAGGIHDTIVWDVAAKRQQFALTLQPALVAFTPDGKQLVTANQAKSVRLWDARTGKPMGGFETEGPEGWVNIFSLALSPDGKHAALKLLNHLVIVQLDSGKVVWREKSQGYQNEPVAFSPDGRLLAFFGDKSVRVWEWAKGRQIESLPGTAFALAGGFAPDGKRLAWAEDGYVHIYDLKKHKDSPLVERCPAARLFALRPDGKAFVAATTLWDTTSGRVLREPRFTTPGTLRCLAFSRDGRRLFLGDYSSTITEVDLTGEEKPRSRTGPIKDQYVIALAPGGERAIAHDGHGHLTHSIADFGRDWRERTGQRVNVLDAAYTPDGKRLIVNSDSEIVYLDAVTGRVLWQSPGWFNVNFFRGSLAGSPDGRLVAAGSERQGGPPQKGCVRLFDAASGAERAKLATPHHCIYALAFSPDSRFLVAASSPYPYIGWVSADEARSVVISLWEIAGGAEIRRFHGHEHLIDGLAFAPDGRTFYSASADSTVLQWDAFGLGEAAARPEQLDVLWNDLADRDAAKAYQAFAALFAAPTQTIAFLKSHLHAVPDVEASDLARAIADLDDERFAVREQASDALTKYGERAESALRKTLEEKPSLEVRRRIEAILEHLKRPLTGEQLRVLRAVAVLEYLGSPSAQDRLQAIARGAPAARQTREAKAALQRLTARKALRD